MCRIMNQSFNSEGCFVFESYKMWEWFLLFWNDEGKKTTSSTVGWDNMVISWICGNSNLHAANISSCSAVCSFCCDNVPSHYIWFIFIGKAICSLGTFCNNLRTIWSLCIFKVEVDSHNSIYLVFYNVFSLATGLRLSDYYTLCLFYTMIDIY